MLYVRQLSCIGIVVFMALFAGLTNARSEIAPQSSTPLACGDGRIDLLVEDFETLDGFTVVKPKDAPIPDPILELVPGCHGQALSFGYDLTNANPEGQSWIVLQKRFPPLDLSAYTHVRLALRGLNVNSHNHVEVKLWDDTLHQLTLKSLTDLPAWRPIYIDLREFSDPALLGLTQITGFEIAVVRCAGTDCEIPDVPGPPPTNELTGTLLIDEFAAVDLKPGGAHRVVVTGLEKVTPNPAVARKAARAIYDERDANGLVPAWFPESAPNYNTYAQAEALLVLTYEYQLTGTEIYSAAVQTMTQQLLDLQIEADKLNGGAWFTGYNQDLAPPNRPLPAGAQQPCDGDETMVDDGRGNLVSANLDACMWVGNVGWMLMALGELRASGIYTDEAALDAALQRGADWIISQIGREVAYPNTIGGGTEGNISAYFGLVAAGRRSEAGRLGTAIFEGAWDPVQRRMKPGLGTYDAATAMDTSGSWGARFLRSIGRAQEALDSQGYTASILRTTSFDDSVSGYGDIAGPYTVALEFTGQAAVAGICDADSVMQELYKLQESGTGAFPGAKDHWYGGTLTPWSTRMTGVSPTAWVYFAATQIDPISWWYTYLPFVEVLRNADQ